MAAGIGPLTCRASGDIYPQRFVKFSGDNTVAQAGANENAIGVSMRQSKAFDSALAASDDGQVAVYTVGQIAKLELGGTVTAGGYIKADTNGKGVAIATSGTTAQNVAAVAVNGGADGEIVDVMVLTLHKVYPALA